MKLMRRAIISFTFIYLVPAAHALTLKEAVLAASEYDASINASRLHQQAGNQKMLQGLSGMLPTLNLDGNYTESDQPGASYAAKVTRKNYSVNLTQPIFDLSTYAGYLKGSTLSDIADIEFLNARRELIDNVASAFFNVLNQREILDAALKATQSFEKQLLSVKEAYQLGNATRADIDESQSRYDTENARALKAHNDLELANVEFKRLSGLNAAEINDVGGACLASPLRNDEKALRQIALQHNLDLQYVYLQYQAAKSDLLVAKSAHLPRVSFQASYGKNWSRAEEANLLDEVFGTTSKTNNTQLSINVSIPLFAGGGNYARTKEAAFLMDETKMKIVDTRRKVESDLRNNYLTIRSNYNLLQAQQRVIQSNTSKLQSTRYEKELGMRTTLDVLNAESSYFNAIKEMANIRYEYLKSKLQLTLLLGLVDYDVLNAFSCSPDK